MPSGVFSGGRGPSVDVVVESESPKGSVAISRVRAMHQGLTGADWPTLILIRAVQNIDLARALRKIVSELLSLVPNRAGLISRRIQDNVDNVAEHRPPILLGFFETHAEQPPRRC